MKRKYTRKALNELNLMIEYEKLNPISRAFLVKRYFGRFSFKDVIACLTYKPNAKSLFTYNDYIFIRSVRLCLQRNQWNLIEEVFDMNIADNAKRIFVYYLSKGLDIRYLLKKKYSVPVLLILCEAKLMGIDLIEFVHVGYSEEQLSIILKRILSGKSADVFLTYLADTSTLINHSDIHKQ